MITYAFILFLQALLFGITAVFNLFTNVSSDSNIAAGISQINAYITAIPFALTIASILASLIFLTVFEGFYWAYKGIKWVYNKIPGIN